MQPSRNYLAALLPLAAALAASAAVARPLPGPPGGTQPPPPARTAVQASTLDMAPPPPLSWYGYQTLAPDLTALALAFISAKTDAAAPAWGAVAIYVGGAPTVHGFHRRPAATVGSVTMRILLPFVTSAVAATTADCSVPVVNDENCDFGEQIAGFVIGMGLAAVIDSAAIAWEREAPGAGKRSATRAAPSPTGFWSLSPVPIRGGAGLAFSGLF